MEYRVSMVVRTLEPWAVIQDFELELEQFEASNKGIIEITEYESQELEPILERHE